MKSQEEHHPTVMSSIHAAGSEIVFVNPHLPDDTLGRVLKGKRLFNLKVSILLRVSRKPTLLLSSCRLLSSCPHVIVARQAPLSHSTGTTVMADKLQQLLSLCFLS
jgi:hypothetical protein